MQLMQEYVEEETEIDWSDMKEKLCNLKMR